MKKDEAKDSTEGSPAVIQRSHKNKKQFAVICVAFLLLLLLVIFVNIWTGDKHRSESYKKVSGAAGLNATIDYDCGARDCKKTFDFNVYIFNDKGQQIGILRPDKNGKVQAAFQEGNYVMLIGKQFGKDKLFPQESVVLKTGEQLELKLQYKERGA